MIMQWINTSLRGVVFVSKDCVTGRRKRVLIAELEHSLYSDLIYASDINDSFNDQEVDWI